MKSLEQRCSTSSSTVPYRVFPGNLPVSLPTLRPDDDQGSFQHIIKKFADFTGITHLTAHALRHTFCHELVTRKIPLDVVARLAGHCKNDRTPNTQQTLVYTAPGEDDLQRAVEELSWS
ncbi:MAG: tyrosine-type recombinase/integrase [Bacillota bacterium]